MPSRTALPSIDNPPKPLVVLFEQLDSVPAWVDWDLMRVASKKIIRSGLLTALSFAAYALPHTYLATANKPLAFTRTLLNKTTHRYAQTLRLITESFLPGGLQRQADGFELVVFVRVLHARIRRQILQSNKWDKSTPELPLNQAHMAMDVIFFFALCHSGDEAIGDAFDAPRGGRRSHDMALYRVSLCHRSRNGLCVERTSAADDRDRVQFGI